MQVTIEIERDLWEATQKKAQAQKTTLEKAVSQLLRVGLAAESKGQAPFTFSLPEGVVRTKEVSEILEDDDE